MQERKNAYLKAKLMLFTVKGSERRKRNRGRRKEKEEKEKKKKAKEKKEEENGDHLVHHPLCEDCSYQTRDLRLRKAECSW